MASNLQPHDFLLNAEVMEQQIGTTTRWRENHPVCYADPSWHILGRRARRH
jgi:hypothetical protein